MSFSKKSFGIGLVFGFLLGAIFIVLIGLSSALFVYKNPQGFWARWVIEKGHLLLQTVRPFETLKNYANSIQSTIKNPELSVKFPLSFQKVGFSGSRVERSDGLISWIAPMSDRIPPGDHPPSNRIKNPGQTRPIELIGLKGETLSFQLVLRSSDNINDISVALVPKSSSDSECIQIHRFREIYLKTMLNQNGSLKKIVNPDPLIPFTDPYRPGHVIISSLSLEENRNLPIWFDIHYSRKCNSKSISGKLEVFNSGKLVRKTVIIFNVLNATLPNRVDLDRWMQLYMGRFNYDQMISNDQDLKTILHRYFVMAHQYGFSTNDCGSIGPFIQWDWNSGKITSVNWDRYDSFMKSELSGKLTGATPNVWCLPIPTYSLGVIGGFTYHGNTPSDIKDWKGIPNTATQELAKIIVKHWEEKGWPLNRAFVYVWDEPGHQYFYPYIYRLIAANTDSLHKGSHEKFRVMLTDNPYILSQKEEDLRKGILFDKIDIWAPISESYIPNRVMKIQNAGKRAWFYQGRPPFIGQSNITSTGPGFRVWFWSAWKYHSNGVFYWAADMWNDRTKAVNPYTNGGVGDGVVFYPGRQLHFLGFPDIEGPIPSIRMAQWRRGYEDYKYFVMLKEKNHLEFANNEVNRLVVRALDEGGYSPPWRNPLWAKPGDWNHDPKIWHQARLDLAKKIAELYGAP